MSKRQSPPVPYKCTSDCRQMGCPGHSVHVIHDLSTDMYIFEFENGERMLFDENLFCSNGESIGGSEMKPKLVLTGRRYSTWRANQKQGVHYAVGNTEDLDHWYLVIGTLAYEYRVQYQTEPRAQDLS